MQNYFNEWIAKNSVLSVLNYDKAFNSNSFAGTQSIQTLEHERNNTTERVPKKQKNVFHKKLVISTHLEDYKADAHLSHQEHRKNTNYEFADTYLKELFEERAAILEFDAGYSRKKIEKLAHDEIRNIYYVNPT